MKDVALKSLFEIMMPVSVILLSFLCILIVLRALRGIRKRRIVHAFQKEYNKTRIPKHFEIKWRKGKDSYPSLDYYTLSFPKWKYATASGLRDRRRVQNTVIRRQSKLYIGRYLIISDDPVSLMRFVNDLRFQGYSIERNKLEQQKYEAAYDRLSARYQIQSIQAIIRLFEECPTDFEEFCAELFELMGFKTQVTARVNDGGYDIYMSKDYLTYIVECKCFSTTHPVGRPLLQKLVGANARQKADGLVFVTTSSFSSPAVEYAKEFGIWLIDGQQLLGLFQTYQGTNLNLAREPQVGAWVLNDEDILAQYPSDM